MPATSKPPCLLLLLALTGCGKFADDLFCESEGCDWKAGEWARVAALANPGPPPPDPSNEYLDDPDAEALGQAFFFDKAFSGVPTEMDGIGRPSPPARTPRCQPLAISCASCHELSRAGVDTTSVPGHVSVGAGWTDVNALGVVNSAYRPVVFWNGRADSLWALNAVVAESPTTLNGNRLRTAHQIADRYRGRYDSVFAARFGLLDIDAINKLPADGKPTIAKTSHYDTLTCDDNLCHTCDAAEDNVPCDERPEPRWEDERRKPKAMVTRILVNWAKAIAAYEYKLNSKKSAFDDFVAAGPGSGVISAAAKRGARLFVGKAGCVDCHLGPQFTDDQFHNIGVPQAGLTVPLLADCPMGSMSCDCTEDMPGLDTTGLKCAPWGAYDGLRRLRDTDHDSRTYNPWLRTGRWSGQPQDRSRDSYVQRPLTDDLKGAWRTPSLRNVALTAPYMHDGRYATLEEVIWHYNTGGQSAGGEVVNPSGVAAQIKPLMLTAGEVADLVAFLETLTDTIPDDLTAEQKKVVGPPTGIGGAPEECTTGTSGAGGITGTTGVGGSVGPMPMPMGGAGGATGMGGSVGPMGGAGGAGGMSGPGVGGRPGVGGMAGLGRMAGEGGMAGQGASPP